MAQKIKRSAFVSQCLLNMLYIFAPYISTVSILYVYFHIRTNSFQFSTLFFVAVFGSRRCKGQDDNCVCANTHFCETRFFVFSHPTERDRGSFTPTMSVTHHEACLSPVQYIWMNRLQSHTPTPALYFCNIHFICMPDVLSKFHYGSSSLGLSHVSLIR